MLISVCVYHISVEPEDAPNLHNMELDKKQTLEVPEKVSLVPLEAQENVDRSRSSVNSSPEDKQQNDTLLLGFFGERMPSIPS